MLNFAAWSLSYPVLITVNAVDYSPLFLVGYISPMCLSQATAFLTLHTPTCSCQGGYPRSSGRGGQQTLPWRRSSPGCTGIQVKQKKNDTRNQGNYCVTYSVLQQKGIYQSTSQQLSTGYKKPCVVRGQIRFMSSPSHSNGLKSNTKQNILANSVP